MAIWTIEHTPVATGTPTTKTLDAWGITNAKRTLVSLSADTLELEPVAEDSLLGNAWNYKDTIKLFKDGVKWFDGIITTARHNGSDAAQSESITVSGPWWWLEQIVLQQKWGELNDAEDGIISRNRSRVLAGMDDAGNLITTGAQITAALTFAITAGAPIALGSILTGQQVWTTDFTDATVGAVVKALLKWHPAALSSIDYTTTPPTLNIEVPSTVDDLHVDDLNQLSFSDGADKSVEGVVFKYERTHDLDGTQITKVTPDIYPVGTPEAGGPNIIVSTIPLQGARSQYQKQQVVVDPLPVDGSSSFTVPDPILRAWWVEHAPWLDTISGDWVLDQHTITFARRSSPADAIDPDAVADSIVASDYPNELISGTVTDWMPVRADRLKVSVWVAYKGTDPVALAKLNDKVSIAGEDYPAAKLEVEITGTDATNRIYSKLTSLSPPEPFPSSLAQAYYEACQEVTWEGDLTYIAQDVTEIAPNRKIRIMEGLTPTERVGASPVQSVSEDIGKGTVKLRFGPAEHLSPQDFLEKARMSRVVPKSTFTKAERADAALTVGGAQVVGGQHTAKSNTVQSPADTSHIDQGLLVKLLPSGYVSIQDGILTENGITEHAITSDSFASKLVLPGSQDVWVVANTDEAGAITDTVLPVVFGAKPGGLQVHREAKTDAEDDPGQVGKYTWKLLTLTKDGGGAVSWKRHVTGIQYYSDRSEKNWALTSSNGLVTTPGEPAGGRISINPPANPASAGAALSIALGPSESPTVEEEVVTIPKVLPPATTLQNFWHYIYENTTGPPLPSSPGVIRTGWVPANGQYEVGEGAPDPSAGIAGSVYHDTVADTWYKKSAAVVVGGVVTGAGTWAVEVPSFVNKPGAGSPDRIIVYNSSGNKSFPVMSDYVTKNDETNVAAKSWVLDEATMVSNDAGKVPTQASVKSYVDNAVSGGLTHKGGYDAATNSPDLDTAPSGVSLGDSYIVTVAGNFFAEAVAVNTTLIADQDNPTTLAHWTVVGSNVDAATTDTPGIVELATNGEMAANVVVQGNDSRLSNARTPTGHTHAVSSLSDATVDAKTLLQATNAGMRSQLNIADGATANSSDDYLLARANHTGTQLLSTISDAGALAALATVGTAQIDNGAVSLVKHANIQTDRIIGRNTASAGAPEELSPATVRGMLTVAFDATNNDTDENLRDRTTHTGFQLIGTITGLQAALDTKASSAHTHLATEISDSTTVGRDLLKAATVDAAKLTLALDADDIPESIARKWMDATQETKVDLLTFGGSAALYLNETGGYSAVSISHVTGLQAALDAKAPTVHTHTMAEITDAGALATLNTVSSPQIQAAAVTLDKIQSIPTGSILGRYTAGTGAPETLTNTQLKAALDIRGADITWNYNERITFNPGTTEAGLNVGSGSPSAPSNGDLWYSGGLMFQSGGVSDEVMGKTEFDTFSSVVTIILADRLPITGGTMTGDITMGGNNILDVGGIYNTTVPLVLGTVDNFLILTSGGSVTLTHPDNWKTTLTLDQVDNTTDELKPLSSASRDVRDNLQGQIDGKISIGPINQGGSSISDVGSLTFNGGAYIVRGIDDTSYGIGGNSLTMSPTDVTLSAPTWWKNALGIDATDVTEAGGRHWLTTAQRDKLNADSIQNSSDVETAYHAQVPTVTGPEISAGTITDTRRYSPADMKSFVTIHAPGGFSGSDIDTLAKLNAIVTDATLINTTDSRLSDARTPTAHTHAQSEITNLVSDLASKASSSHTHSISDTTGLQTALNGKAAVSHTHSVSDVSTLQSQLDGKSSENHVHTITDVTNLNSTLNGLANAVHTHVISDITSLQSELAGKASSGHQHTTADITNFPTPPPTGGPFNLVSSSGSLSWV